MSDASRQTGVTIRNFLRIHFNRYIHREERNREFLRSWSRRLLIDVRIHTTHTDILTLFRCSNLLKDGIDRRTVAGFHAHVLPDNLAFLIHEEH